MAVLLTGERRGLKERLFLALVYAFLILGGLTMVYPFAVMIASSCTSSYDYRRNSPIVKGLYDRSDRYMRAVATYFQTFPRDLYPTAPANWTSWDEVSRDAAGVKAFVAQELAPYADERRLEEARTEARAYLRSLLDVNPGLLHCRYDPRDVPRFVEEKYGSLKALNDAWPVPHKSFFDVSFLVESRRPLTDQQSDDPKTQTFNDLKRHYIQEAIERGDYVSRTLPPVTDANRAVLREAFAAQFLDHGWRDFFDGMLANYRLVGDFLFLRGRAFLNTLILVLLTVLASLTINPLAAYALSRFRMKSTESILLFLLATMAFPAAVTAIPGFLLIRDLGLLNTFAALVLPTVASGMSIFILKGFFDALPRELYEAAAIDGAGEWTVFLRMTLPMTAPILAVNALQSFIHAYSSWEWAFLVCQKESHWTIAVWMYQFSQIYAHQPWCVMAGFVLVSLPMAIVFLACQKVILKGIVLPGLK